MPGAMPAPADEPSRAQYFLCAGLLIVLAGQALYYYPQLPEHVASHFDGDGRPNGWTSREGFFGGVAFVVLIQSAAFLGLPRVLGRFPIAFINLPNKQYWLAPERKQESLAYMTQMMAWFGAAILGMIVIINQMVIQANLGAEKRLSGLMWVVLAAFLGFVIVWMVILFRRFRLPP